MEAMTVITLQKLQEKYIVSIEVNQSKNLDCVSYYT